MPLITAHDLKSYSTFPQVQGRADLLLEQDIVEAEIDIEEAVGHLFDEPHFQPLPNRVKIAALKLAQYYAMYNSDEDLARGITQERHENYSYTRANGDSIQKPDVSKLLAPYVLKAELPKRSNNMRMRVL